jgi:hypothetical protein
MTTNIAIPAGNMTASEAVVAVNIDPTTGQVIGTAGQPLITQTSSLQTTADLTSALVTISTATTTTLVSATAATKCRVYRMRVDVGAADVLTFNAAVNDVQTYIAAGFRIYDFNTRPWFTTATNTAFTVTTTTTGVVNILVEYTKVA